MGLFRRRRGSGAEAPDRRQAAAAAAHLSEFAQSRKGVEAYIEPVTTLSGTTVVFVADTGEWTRRRVADPAAARALARKLGIPVYEAALMGYPKRMREWTRRQAGEGS
ncbi:hypothetical protein [Embleya sp. NBC_00896]|uniref:hypothetical protein n=1 Tax=Embleya sp. NBC_00896 TaxID=2975961 RepID=UPI00386C4AE8|nr:hypothetical protein OG928_23930 [Embleya sp. NBC_00896]